MMNIVNASGDMRDTPLDMRTTSGVEGEAVEAEQENSHFLQ